MIQNWPFIGEIKRQTKEDETDLYELWNGLQLQDSSPQFEFRKISWDHDMIEMNPSNIDMDMSQHIVDINK